MKNPYENPYEKKMNNQRLEPSLSLIIILLTTLLYVLAFLPILKDENPNLLYFILAGLLFIPFVKINFQALKDSPKEATKDGSELGPYLQRSGQLILCYLASFLVVVNPDEMGIGTYLIPLTYLIFTLPLIHTILERPNNAFSLSTNNSSSQNRQIQKKIQKQTTHSSGGFYWKDVSEVSFLDKNILQANEGIFIAELSDSFKTDSYRIEGKIKCHGCHEEFNFRAFVKKGYIGNEKKVCPNCFVELKVYTEFRQKEDNSNLILKAIPETNLKNRVLHDIEIKVSDVTPGESEISKTEDIFIIAEGNDSNKFMKLLENIEDVNITDELDNTLLAYAAAYHSVNVVDFLIKKGADINYKSKSGAFPLGSAISMGRIDNFKSLLAAGADVNRNANNSGYTALMEAVVGISNLGEEEKYLEIIKLLIGKGAETNVSDTLGNSLQDLARSKKNPKVMEALKQK